MLRLRCATAMAASCRASTLPVMRLDMHVHTEATRRRVRGRLGHTVPACGTTPERAYALARARGMDLVTVTDRDTIDGALRLAGLPGVVVGCEVTAVFPEDGVHARLHVFGLDEAAHREIQRLRRDIRRLLPALRAHGLFTSLSQVARPVAGPFSAVHLLALLPWVDALETRNGGLTAGENRVAHHLAVVAGKAAIGGSDAYAAGAIARTWTDVPGATTAAEFFAGLRQGRGRVGGAEAAPWPAHARAFGRRLWRLVRDERHDSDLLVDLLSRPALARALLADAA